MLVTNLQISRTLRILPIILGLLVALDLTLYFIPDFLGNLKVNGYLAVSITALTILFYSYVGFPIFTLDAKSDIVKIKSHLALSKLFGKSRRIPKMNITNLEIDTSGIRRKLIISYLYDGKEIRERFNVTLLSRRKYAMLEAAIEDLRRENSPRNLHYFI